MNNDIAAYKYKSFISYSHSDDKWVKWLHRALETYHIPPHLIGKKYDFGEIPKRLSPIFRDRDELPSATDLSTIINKSLEQSATQIVICSPKAAQSQWVNEEILTFKRLGKSHRILCIIVSGEPYASGMPGREEEECFPKALRFQLGEDNSLSDVPAEPIAADVRQGKDGKSNAKIKLIAGILGVGFDDLRQRELQRRNRRMMYITSSAIAGMVFAIGLATAAIIARNEAEVQRERAETEAETARQTASFMVDLFAVSDPSEARGNTITAREILDKGAKRIDTELAEQPKIQATLMDTIGSVYTSLGLYKQARPLLKSSLEKKRSLDEMTEKDIAQSLNNLASLLTEQAEFEEAEALYLEAIKKMEASADEHSLLVSNYAGLAELYFRMSQFEQAEVLLVKVLQAQQSVFGENSLETADATEELGLNYYDQGDLEKAAKLLRQALMVREGLFDNKPHPDWAENLNNLATLLHDLREYEEAETLYTRALEMQKLLVGDAHPGVANMYNNLAYLHHDRKNYEKAELMYRKAIAILEKVHGESHPEIARTLNNLSYLLYDKGQREAAIRLVGKALDVAIQSLGKKHNDVAGYSATKARWLAENNDYQQSALMLKEALSIREELLEKDHPILIVTRLDLVVSLVGLEELEEALDLAKNTYISQVNSRGGEHWLTFSAASAYGHVLSRQNRFDEAEEYLVNGFDGLKKDDNVRPMFVRQSIERLIDFYESRQQSEKAEIFKSKLLAFNEK